MNRGTARTLARASPAILDRVALGGESVAIERDGVTVARLVPPKRAMTAAEATEGLSGRLTECRIGFADDIGDPWA
jgi:antitoxin (DNA-binding transcriptional repressor) of toxin-antitoxin stability system